MTKRGKSVINYFHTSVPFFFFIVPTFSYFILFIVTLYHRVSYLRLVLVRTFGRDRDQSNRHSEIRWMYCKDRVKGVGTLSVLSGRGNQTTLLIYSNNLQSHVSNWNNYQIKYASTNTCLLNRYSQRWGRVGVVCMY